MLRIVESFSASLLAATAGAALVVAVSCAVAANPATTGAETTTDQPIIVLEPDLSWKDHGGNVYGGAGLGSDQLREDFMTGIESIKICTGSPDCSCTTEVTQIRLSGEVTGTSKTRTIGLSLMQLGSEKVLTWARTDENGTVEAVFYRPKRSYDPNKIPQEFVQISATDAKLQYFNGSSWIDVQKICVNK